jgi:hypothetical protein
MLQESCQGTEKPNFLPEGTKIRANFIQRRLAAGKVRSVEEEREKSREGEFVTIRSKTAILKFDILK